MALQLFQEMRTYGIEPNIISYNATISACEKGVQWDKAMNLFKDMQINSIDPNIISYSETIGACFNSCKYKEAFKQLQEGQSNGHFPKVSKQISSTWDLHVLSLPVSCIILYKAFQVLVEQNLRTFYHW